MEGRVEIKSDNVYDLNQNEIYQRIKNLDEYNNFKLKIMKTFPKSNYSEQQFVQLWVTHSVCEN
jgi:hypothetical protein